MKLTKLILLMAVTMLLSNCTIRLVDFTVISSKNHGLKFDKSAGKRVKGKSISPLGFYTGNVKEAMDMAIESAGPDYDLLIDGVVKAQRVPFAIIYIVEGTAVSSANIKAQLGEQGFKDWCKANNLFDPETEQE